MAPPNSVALASPLPNSYFPQATGVLASFPSQFQFHSGSPLLPGLHHDIDSTGRTLSRYPVMPGPIEMPPVAPRPVISPYLGSWRTWLNNAGFGGGNPLSGLAGRLRELLPGIPERNL